MRSIKIFPSQITRREMILGAVIAIIHCIAAPLALFFVSVPFDTGTVNLIYYCVSFVLVLALLGRYLKREFYSLTEHIFRTIFGMLIGYLAMSILSNAVLLIEMSAFESELTNPNNDAVAELAKLDSRSVAAASILLAPVVEETIFRGVIFGGLRKRSRALAYIGSFAAFAVYHIWQYAVVDFSPRLIFVTLEYLPASIGLAIAYEKSDNLWCPIFLHSVVNLISINYYINL